jgi:Mg2+ and Co2+ transporter CorA
MLIACERLKKSEVNNPNKRWWILIILIDIISEPLSDEIQNFIKAAKGFEDIIDKTSKSDALNVRLINDRLVALEKSFINEGDTPILSDIKIRR